MRFWLINTKIVRKTASEETTTDKTPNGKGSNGFTPGANPKLITVQPATKTTCSIKNVTLPANLVIASLARSVEVRLWSASSSSLAIAAMLNSVGCAFDAVLGWVLIGKRLLG